MFGSALLNEVRFGKSGQDGRSYPAAQLNPADFGNGVTRAMGLPTIRDDGHGFDIAATRAGASGLGLVSIEGRAHVVHGEVDIISDPQRGTTIHVQCPALAAGPAFAEDHGAPIVPLLAENGH